MACKILILTQHLCKNKRPGHTNMFTKKQEISHITVNTVWVSLRVTPWRLDI